MQTEATRRARGTRAATQAGRSPATAPATPRPPARHHEGVDGLVRGRKRLHREAETGGAAELAAARRDHVQSVGRWARACEVVRRGEDLERPRHVEELDIPESQDLDAAGTIRAAPWQKTRSFGHFGRSLAE